MITAATEGDKNSVINDETAPFHKDLGRTFSELRKKSGYSLVMLSSKCALPVMLIDNFENGTVRR